MRSLFNCIHCLMKFKRKEDLAKHILKEHKIKDNSGAIMNDKQHDSSESFGIAEYLDGKFSKEHIYSEQDVIYIVNIATAKAQAEIEEAEKSYKLSIDAEIEKTTRLTNHGWKLESRIAELEQLNEKLKQNMKKVSEGTTHIVENKDNKIKKLNSRIKELEQTAVDMAVTYQETLDKIKRHKCNCRNKEKS